MVERFYPEYRDVERFGVTPCKTIPKRGDERLSIGKITSGNTREILGWHGDLVYIINCEELPKRALIFEIKYGRMYISNGQHMFFRDVVLNPQKYMKKMEDARVILVRCWNLNIGDGTLDVRFETYRGESSPAV